ncbi:hypothetical protein [Symmachiella dynata]|uniref:hypothetical protein n=1 Tax=Symmachiella dynata TaxID=2527995 RepID=UPI0030EE46EA|tara:strand:- start:429 stop:902 length:474 start_codon:yes stop_codon:yes gene_type:complete
MEPEIDAIFRQFIERVDRDTVAEMAERVLTDKAPHGGGMSVFANAPGGLIGFTIRKLLLDSVASGCWTDLDELAKRLARHYGFPADWVPPRLLVREALAMTVHRRGIIERLQRELGKSVGLAPMFDRAAASLRCVEDAFLFGDDRADALLAELQQVK